MSRRIDLVRIHAINWFGYNDVLDVNGNLLIAGVTGSGKSVLMDLIQLVLVGDQRAKYNQSATGSASTRTLKSYCLGDTKQDLEGASQYMRDRGAVTYVAMEFQWPDKKRVETWGLRIEFESAAQHQPNRKHGFMLNGPMRKQDWLHEDRTPLDYATFRKLADSRGGRLFDTMESYRREMGLPSHLNFDRTVLDYLLPAAMSFTFLKSFNDFCRRYILPVGEVDIQPVKESYQTFRNLERELGILRDQFERLTQICDSDQERSEAERDRFVFHYVEHELKVEAVEERVDALEKQERELSSTLEEDNRRLENLELFLNQNTATLDALKTALTATEEGKLFLHLRAQSKRLVAEVERLKATGRNVQQAVEARSRHTQEWVNLGAELPEPLEGNLAQTISTLAAKLESEPNLVTAARKLALSVQEAIRSVETSTRALFQEETRLERERNRLQELIAALRLGVVPDASILLNVLNDRLPRDGSDKPAYALREVCEVTDEEWRPAIETAFGRKFAVIVDPANFDEAEQIYLQLKQEASRESLINPTQALELRGEARTGSLAEKLETSHPVARAVVNHTLGDLMCVKDVRELRNHHRAILPDGFSYTRPFVERRQHYRNDPCIGKRGIERQREYLQNQLDFIQSEQRVLAPKCQAVRDFIEFARSRRLDSESVHEDVAEAARLPEKQAELEDTLRQISAIRDQGMDEKEVKIAELESQIAAARHERDGLLRNQKQTELVNVRKELNHARERRELVKERFLKFQAEGADISLYLPRREAVRKEALEQRPDKEQSAEFCHDQSFKAAQKAGEARTRLVELRKALAIKHPVYLEYDPEMPDNSIYVTRRDKIAAGDIPGYEQKAARERSNWHQLFRTQVLAKLHAALFEVENLLALLNQELRHKIDTSRYQITRKPNADAEYEVYRNLVEASAGAREDDLFFASLDVEMKKTIEDIFEKLTENPESREALAFLDYRNYHDYDMQVTDTRYPDARPVSVDRHSGKFSGGENQTPYFIAILACYLRAYHRYERRRKDPSLALVPIDEAFSKLSGERIRACIHALKTLDLQGIFSMSSGNIPYAMDMCDQMITVMKRERSAGGKVSIRNIPVVLTREEAVKRYGHG